MNHHLISTTPAVGAARLSNSRSVPLSSLAASLLASQRGLPDIAEHREHLYSSACHPQRKKMVARNKTPLLEPTDPTVSTSAHKGGRYGLGLLSVTQHQLRLGAEYSTSCREWYWWDISSMAFIRSAELQSKRNSYSCHPPRRCKCKRYVGRMTLQP